MSERESSLPIPRLLEAGVGSLGPGPRFLLPCIFCSLSDSSTRSWPPGSRIEGDEDEKEEESFLQPVDDYFVEPLQAEEEEEEERVPPSSSHLPAGVSKGEAISEGRLIWGVLV